MINTFLLLAALTLTAHWASGGATLRLKGQRVRVWAFGLGFLAVLALGMTGAVTALGDTLFPPESLAEGLRQDLDPAGNFMVRLRVVHPVVAVAAGFYLFMIAGASDKRERHAVHHHRWRPVIISHGSDLVFRQSSVV